MNKWTTPPGATIRDILETKNISVDQVNHELDEDIDIYDLLTDRRAIDGRIADRLSRYLYGTKRFWIERESKYRNGEEVRKYDSVYRASDSIELDLYHLRKFKYYQNALVELTCTSLNLERLKQYAQLELKEPKKREEVKNAVSLYYCSSWMWTIEQLKDGTIKVDLEE